MNYTKKAGQFVCKMAMPLALMFAACSSDSDPSISKTESDPGVEMGGSSEEPRIVASILARAYYAPAGNEEGSTEDVSVSVPTNVFYGDGQITLTELDTATLEPLNDSAMTEFFKGVSEDTLTGERIPGDNGMARFDSVSLRSPIVLLEAVSGAISLSAIVDVRDTNTFVIDGFSHLVAYRMRKLAESEVPFAQARTQAETEVANALGFGPLPVAAEWRKAFNESLPFDLVQRLKEEIGEVGSLADLSEDSRKSLTDAVERSPYWRFLSVSRKALEMWDEDFYQECVQLEEYDASLLASVFGVGQCSSENEGALADIQGDLFELKCESGFWKLAYRKTSRLNIAHTFGTMIDSRDGEKYKTVTIDLGGTSQTWMAENLNYATEKSSCFRDDSSNCSVYGRLYSIFPLDSIYNKYASEEDCVADRMNAWLTEYRAVADSLDEVGPLSESDSLRFIDDAHRLCKELHENPENPDNVNWSKVIDSLDVLNYDVCPEGWRMPSYEDWNTLLSYLDGLGQDPALTLLLANYGDPTGFGLDLLADIRGEKGYYKVGVRGVGEYQFEPAVTPEEIRGNAAGDVMGSLVTQTTSRRKGANVYYEAVVLGYGLPGYGYVRCIKDE